MHRFTDIESTSKQLPPIYSYLTHQLVSLPKALEPISTTIDQLDRFSRIAKNECHFPSKHGLTRDESAAIYLYTMDLGENSFYQVINRALRAEDRSLLKPWFAYLKLLDVAIQKLPTVRKNLWRGVSIDITTNFQKGDEFTWWAMNSCSTSDNIIKNLLGSNSTLFLIEAKNGKDISSYANCPSENEVILCSGTRFRVVTDPLEQPPMHLIHLQEVTDDEEESLSIAFKTMTTTLTPTTASTHTPTNVQTSLILIHTDRWGNRYEGEMKDGKKHGKGHMDFANGDRFTGDYIEDSITGQGVYIYANGARYEGQWKDSKKHGKGQMDFDSSIKYISDWIEDNRGQFKDNKEHGKGQADFVNGDKYTGDWINSDRTGQGLYIFANGDRYEGQWKDNKRHGKGNMDFASGVKYTGDYIDNKRAGQGICVYANGDRYESRYL
ncbi:unnamed protein product [Adineta steineri]|uniref:NAD(P)(+)--arginine ADP-ribosyltransferase n=2 Tax=Adineta steineri TaxID=433720 RepID=A0A819ICB2_9BILA|nr:unnamed protein product [Adineta steineri]